MLKFRERRKQTQIKVFEVLTFTALRIIIDKSRNMKVTSELVLKNTIEWIGSVSILWEMLDYRSKFPRDKWNHRNSKTLGWREMET